MRVVDDDMDRAIALLCLTVFAGGMVLGVMIGAVLWLK